MRRACRHAAMSQRMLRTPLLRSSCAPFSRFFSMFGCVMPVTAIVPALLPMRNCSPVFFLYPDRSEPNIPFLHPPAFQPSSQ